MSDEKKIGEPLVVGDGLIGRGEGVEEWKSGRPARWLVREGEAGDGFPLFEDTVDPGMRTPLHTHPAADETLYSARRIDAAPHDRKMGSGRLHLWASSWRLPGDAGLSGLQPSNPQSESKSGWLEYSLAISFRMRQGVVDSFGHVPQRVTYSSGRVPPDTTTIVRSLWRSTCARRRTVSTLVFSARRARRNALMFTLGNYA